MNTAPDGVEVVATHDEAERLQQSPLLVLDSLAGYLDERGLGRGPLSWQRIGEGQANITYLLQVGERLLVLRRGPRPPYPPSAHDMLRESAIQQLVANEGVPVPAIVSTCGDEGVIGAPFYLMDFCDGVVITDTVPPELDTIAQRRATGYATIDTLVRLHALDVREGPLASIGRPDGYLERQVRRFGGIWQQVAQRTLPEVQELASWLAGNIPATQRPALVHGDYRIGNLMFHHSAPARVAAVLDWEMATLGDPLADLGYLTATYSTPGSRGTPIELTPVTRLEGYPTQNELIERYADQSGLDVSTLGWYQAFALWKAAIFCEAIYTRWVKGERPGDTFAPSLEAGIPAMIAAAFELIDSGCSC